jgi:hypothetical protein
MVVSWVLKPNGKNISIQSSSVQIGAKPVVGAAGSFWPSSKNHPKTSLSFEEYSLCVVTIEL